MNKDEIKIGMVVDYHSVICGPITKHNCTVESDPWKIGYDELVVLISGVSGGVSLEAISEATKEEIDTDGTYHPTCPHCGFVDQDAEWYDEDPNYGREHCTECGGWFTWVFEVTPSFWTKKIDWVMEWRQYNKTKIQMSDLKAMDDNKGR